MNEKTNNIREDVEIDLQKLLLAYLRKWWVIVGAALIVGIVTLICTKNFVTPQYRASVTIYVNSVRSDKTDDIEYLAAGNLDASQMLVRTYANIIRSNTVLNRVIEKSGLDYTAEEIREIMSSEQVNNTEMLRIYIKHPDPATAAHIANAVARSSLSSIEEIVEGSSAKVVDYAVVPTERYSPSYSKNAMIGALIGAVVALLYVTLRYLMDVRLKTSEDLEALFEVPVLGQIPAFVSQETKSGYGYEHRNVHHSDRKGQ